MRKRKLQQLNLVATKWGMPMRGGPRSIIKLGSDQVGDADVRRTPHHKYSLVATKRGIPYARRRLLQIHARLATAAFMRDDGCCNIFFLRKNR